MKICSKNLNTLRYLLSCEDRFFSRLYLYKCFSCVWMVFIEESFFILHKFFLEIIFKWRRFSNTFNEKLVTAVDGVARFARGIPLLGRMYVQLYCTVHVENYISYKILLKSTTPLATVSTMATGNPIPHNKSLRKWGYACTNT